MSRKSNRLFWAFGGMVLVFVLGVNLLLLMENHQKKDTLKNEPTVNKAEIGADRDDWRKWHQQTSEITALVEVFDGKVNGWPKIGIRDFAVWLRCKINLSDSQFGDAELANLIRLDQPHELYFGKNKVPEDCGIRGLRLDRTQITDAGLVELQRMKDLTELSLIETAITDAGLVNLQQLSNLQVLRLDRTHISGRGLDALKDLTNLKTLGLWETQVTADGLAQLQQALPNCKIFANHETSGEHVFHDREEVWDYFATKSYVVIGRVGDTQWPARVTSENEAMDDITFVRSNGGKHLFPGLDGYRQKLVALEDSAGTETAYMFRSEEKLESATSGRRPVRSPSDEIP